MTDNHRLSRPGWRVGIALVFYAQGCGFDPGPGRWHLIVLKCDRLMSVDLLACKGAPAGQNSGTSGDADIMSATMTPTPTYKNRMQKCRAKKKENVEKWKEYLEKDRLRNKRNREREKVACENYDNALKARREKIRLRVQAWRRKKALEKTNNGLLQTPPGTYKCKNTLHKAVSKACRALPYSPNKKESSPEPKPPATRRHSVDVRTVKDFYNSDEISWQTPGTRQFKSVKDKETGIRSHKQKRYLIMNISEAHQVFQEKFDVKISRSKFYDLRPENVFPVATTPHNVLFLKPDTDLLQEVKWKKWEKNNSGQLTLASKTSTLKSILTEINNSLPAFKCHVFVQKQQAKYFDEKKTGLKPGEVVLQVDYAENYSLILQDEVQSAHWQHPQVTLFIACFWHEKGISSYVVVSDDLTHSKESAWLFLKSIVSDFQKETDCSLMTHLYIFSDNCAAQFRSKFTVHNLCYLADDLNVVYVEWNTFAPGHGKGAVDAIELSPTVNILYVAKSDVDSTASFLNERWKDVQEIHGIRKFHHFQKADNNFIFCGLTAGSHLEKVQVTKSTTSNSRRRLFCNEVYTDSEEEEEEEEEEASIPPNTISRLSTDSSLTATELLPCNINPGKYVLVTFGISRPNKFDQYRYVGICQTHVDDDDEVRVVFLKLHGKTGRLFKIDERDEKYIRYGHTSLLLQRYFYIAAAKLRVVFTRKPKVARCKLLFVLRNPSAAKVATGGCESVHTHGATFAAAIMLQSTVVMDEIKMEPEVDPLDLQLHDNTCKIRENSTLLEEGNLSHLQVADIKTECVDRRYDLASEMKVEDTPEPVSSPIVKSEVETTSVPFIFAMVNSEVDDHNKDKDQNKDHEEDCHLRPGFHNIARVTKYHCFTVPNGKCLLRDLHSGPAVTVLSR
ncbi:hypothetical protein ANN_27417 [Periplaneta americana]|uniref:Uncharacterized protein n=1 Tax=Periplaneta americana TaxID=6978 RepID=A0ABQ8RVZ4_PERAM|nr:hypothetical protein ANN_27417 [Periplaneta americana]